MAILISRSYFGNRIRGPPLGIAARSTSSGHFGLDRQTGPSPLSHPAFIRSRTTVSFDKPRRLPASHRNIEELRDDGLPTGRHDGDAQLFLRRHVRDCSRYDRSTRKEQIRFIRGFIERIADTRNLQCAVQHLASKGDKAPGPNRQRLKRRLADNPAQVWAELRRIRRRILDGSYVPDGTTRLWIPKSSGKGKRPIEVSNWQDQVVQRAIVQIVQPLLDPQLDDLSLGYRPGRDRAEALIRADLITQTGNRHVWIAADLKDAFTTIPHTALWDALRQWLGNERLVRLIRRIVTANGREKGVPQGGALSPLLLNLFLDRALDTKWRRKRADTPLIRVADDLLIPCRSVNEAQEAYQDLQTILKPTGMRLKGTPESDIVDLGSGQTAEWLGYAISRNNGELTVRTSRRLGTKLQLHLERELAEPDGALHVGETLRGVIDQLGPCYPHEDQVRVIRHITAIAHELGAEETPPEDELLRLWERAYTRYLTRRNLLQSISDTLTKGIHNAPGQGSAAGHREPVDTNRGGNHIESRDPQISMTSSTETTAVLWTDGACLRSGSGGWAFHLMLRGAAIPLVESGACDRTTNNRMELTAVIRGLQQLSDGETVRLYTDSRYVAEGIANRMESWRRWQRQSGGILQNWDLWAVLSDLVSAHRLQVMWVRGHSGHRLNELCDNLASRAAEVTTRLNRA